MLRVFQDSRIAAGDVSGAEPDFRLQRQSSLALVFVGVAILGGQYDLLEMPPALGRSTPSRGVAGIGFLLVAIAIFQYRDSTAGPPSRKGLGFAASLTLLSLSLGNLILHAFPISEFLYQADLLMAPVATAGFTFLGAWLTAAYLRPDPPGLTLAGFALAATGFVSLLAYAYGVPLALFDSVYLGALTASGFILGGIGLCTLPPNARFPLRVFCEDSVQSLLLRTFLPPLVLLLIALDIGNHFVRYFAGFNPAIRDVTAILVVTAILTVVLTRISRQLGNRLDRADSERRRAEEELRLTNQRLEETVDERTEALAKALKKLELIVTQLHERERQLIEVSGREQQRLGRELHDQVGQLLTGIGFLSRGIETQLKLNQAIDAKAVTSLREISARAVEQTRALARTYTPLHLQSHGLGFLLEELCHTVSETYGIECVFSSAGDLPQISQDDQLHLYRIAQEAVNNAVKHTGNPTIRIDLNGSAAGLDLTVINTGAPRNEPKQEVGLGLAIMAYRAETIGATLTIDSDRSNRFEVRCHLPSYENHAETNPTV